MNIYFNSRLNWFAVDSPDLENYLYVFLKDGRRNNSDISKLDAGFRKEDWITCSVEPEINTFVDGDLWDKDASEDTPPQSSQLSDCVKKELQQQSDNLNKVISSHLQKEKEEFTVLAYKYRYAEFTLTKDPLFKLLSKPHPLVYLNLFGIRDTPPADFKDRTILSVRRNSDGEVFSVGDYVEWSNVESYPTESIEFVNSDLCLGVTLDYQTKGFRSLSTAKKAYKVEDGYVCEGDTVYTLNEICKLGVGTGTFEHKFTKDMLDSGVVLYKNKPPQELEAVRTFNSPEDAEIIAELENRVDNLKQKNERRDQLLNNILNLITGYFDGE